MGYPVAEQTSETIGGGVWKSGELLKDGFVTDYNGTVHLWGEPTSRTSEVLNWQDCQTVWENGGAWGYQTQTVPEVSAETPGEWAAHTTMMSNLMEVTHIQLTAFMIFVLSYCLNFLGGCGRVVGGKGKKTVGDHFTVTASLLLILRNRQLIFWRYSIPSLLHTTISLQWLVLHIYFHPLQCRLWLKSAHQLWAVSAIWSLQSQFSLSSHIP
jgi:hypothetical protein